MSRQYLIRLDDAAPNMNHENWDRIEKLLLQYNICPLIGVIPNNKDEQLLKYPYDEKFWDKVEKWISYGWVIAMHGYNHVY
ncbi:MAG: DUF2334 domain-containing protein, partial [Bacillota bacterium]|nr:DUF2334 domain-containing protein [Bacillota bacterium]